MKNIDFFQVVKYKLKCQKIKNLDSSVIEAWFELETSRLRNSKNK